MSNIPEQIGPYQILREAGRGGMFTVYEAVDTRIGRVVAVKVLSGLPQLSEEERQRQTARIYQEGRAVAGLSHPNIVMVFDVGELPAADDSSPPLPYLVMEFLRGETLRERLRRVGALSPQEATLILDQAAQGLHAAHAAGIVHRDLKPGNIMLLPDGSVKIMDFGLAQRQGAEEANSGLPPATSAGDALTGSPAYMSPEQARGEPVTTASDIWSLGVVLHEMLSGENPFASDSGRDDADATFNRVLTMRPALPANIGPRAQRVLEHALDPEPQGRFSTAPAFADAFRMAWVTDRGAPALPADAPEEDEEQCTSYAGVAAVPAAATTAELSSEGTAAYHEPTPALEISNYPEREPAALPVAREGTETYLPARQQQKRRASWLVPALLALIVFGLAVSLPLLFDREKGPLSSAARPADRSVAVVTAPPASGGQDSTAAEPTTTAPVRPPSPAPAKQPPPQKGQEASKLPDAPVAAVEKPQPPSPGPVVITEKPQPLPPRPSPPVPKEPPASPQVSDRQGGSERREPVTPSPSPPGPRGARAPAVVIGPPTSPEVEGSRDPEAPRTLPDDEAVDTDPEESVTFLGEWRGRHTGHRATLFIDREELNGTFTGTLTVQIPAGRVVLEVAGRIDDESGEPRVIIRERRIREEPVKRSWDLGVNEGRLRADGRIMGTGKDARGRSYQWQFRR